VQIVLIPSDSGTGLAVETNEPTEEQEGSNNDEEVQRVQAVRSNVPASRSSGRLVIKSTLPQALGEDMLGANKPSRRRTYKPKTSKEERARMKNAKAEEALALQQQKKEKKLEDAVNKEKKTAERFKEEAKEEKSARIISEREVATLKEELRRRDTEIAQMKKV
jgi:hypothetical protein